MVENRQTRRRVAREYSHDARVIRLSVLHIVFVLVAIFALSIQTLIVQPHLHLWRTSGSTQTLNPTRPIAPSDRAHSAANQSALALPDKYPINEDPSNCPLCQEIAHSGQFVPSGASLSTLLLFLSMRFTVFDAALPSLLTISHIWQGRAPPQR